MNSILKEKVIKASCEDRSATLEELENSIPKVSISWANRMISSHKDFKLARPRVVDKDRSEGCRDTNIKAWFELWDEKIIPLGVHPAMLANFDETMIESHPNSRTRVVSFSDKKSSVVVTDVGLPHITLGVTIFADGTRCDHLLIYPMQTVPKEARGANSLMFTGYSISGQESGWITIELFEQHCRQTIIPAFLEKRRRLELKGMTNVAGVFVVDGHSSRMNSALMREFSDNNILVPVLPAHTSHVLQPLDLAVFGSFKAGLTQGDSALRKMTLPDRRYKLLEKSISELHKALNPITIRKSFERSGLYPFDPSTPLQHPCVLITLDDKPLVIDKSLKGDACRYEIGGKVISEFAEREQICLVESRRKSAKIPKSQDYVSPVDIQRHVDPLSVLQYHPKRKGRPPGSKNKPKIVPLSLPPILDLMQQP